MKNLKEKLMAFLRDEKVKKITKRVLNKKTFVTAIVILIIASALKISFALMFETKGTVKSIDGKNITVVNFITTKTVATWFVSLIISLPSFGPINIESFFLSTNVSLFDFIVISPSST